MGVKSVSGNNMLKLQFYTYLGDAYNRAGNYRLSDESYEKALIIDPENSFVLNNYAYYLSLRNENLAKAETMSAKAVKLDPENAANMDTYGWVLYKLGRYKEAAEWVGKAVAATPKTDPDLMEHLGDINFKLGNADKAVEFWQEALKAGKGSEFLEKKIKERKLYE
jgi:Tfp pilus assembly protein PilF